MVKSTSITAFPMPQSGPSDSRPDQLEPADGKSAATRGRDLVVASLWGACNWHSKTKGELAR